MVILASVLLITTAFYFQYFGVYIDQMVRKFSEGDGASASTRREVLSVKKPSVHKMSHTGLDQDGLENKIDKFYFISGHTDVYLLNHDRSESKPYAEKLTKTQINDLPMEHSYSGGRAPTYLTDEKAAMMLLLRIILLFNLMQGDNFFLSFPLGSLYAINNCQGHQIPQT